MLSGVGCSCLLNRTKTCSDGCRRGPRFEDCDSVCEVQVRLKPLVRLKLNDGSLKGHKISDKASDSDTDSDTRVRRTLMLIQISYSSSFG